MSNLGHCARLLLFVLVATAVRAESLRVRIVDQQGRAIPTAVASVGRSTTLRPDADGLIAAEVVPPLTIRVSAPGFLTLTNTLDAVPEEEIVVELHPSPVYSTVDVVVRAHEIEAGPAVANSVGNSGVTNAIRTLLAWTLGPAINTLRPPPTGE